MSASDQRLMEALRAARERREGPKIDTGQEDLFRPRPAARPAGPTESEIEEQFRRFHRENPEVYRKLVELTRRVLSRRSSGHVGLWMIWERLRWDYAVEVDTPNAEDAFKLNDHHIAHYARLIMATEPDLAEVFEVRELRAPRRQF